MGPPPRSFAADAHDCIMVRPPVDQPNTRVWRDDPRPMASSPLIVDGFRPTHVSSDVRTASDAGKRAQPSQHGDRSASAACDTPKAGVAGRKNSSGQVRNDGRGPVESDLGRNRLTSDAPYKAMLWLRKGFGFAGAWTVCEQNRLLAVCFGLPEVNKA